MPSASEPQSGLAPPALWRIALFPYAPRPQEASGGYGMRNWPVLLAALVGLSVATPAAADDLGRVWRESEVGWDGTWTRRGNSNVFDAVWTKAGERETAMLTISIRGSEVSVLRDNGRNRTCRYDGRLHGNTVQGSYRCDGSGRLEWSATIHQEDDFGPGRRFSRADDDLGRIWDEEESGWQGVWMRRGRSNIFDASWTHPGERPESAVLTILVRGQDVRILRDQGRRGTCSYSGTMDRRREVRGTYSCSWGGGTLNWRARISD